MLIRSFVQEELQLNHVKHKQLHPQVLFATLTHDDQINFTPVNCLVKHETVLPSLKGDYHPGPAHFGNHQFAMRNDKEVEKNVVKKLESFFFDAVQPIQVPVEKPITKTAKKLIQQFFSDADNGDPVWRRKSQSNIRYRTDLVLVQKVEKEEKTTTSLINKLCTSEISIDSEGKKLQPETIHQTNPSAMEPSLVLIMKEKIMLLKHWVLFRLMLYSRSKFHR